MLLNLHPSQHFSVMLGHLFWVEPELSNEEKCLMKGHNVGFHILKYKSLQVP